MATDVTCAGSGRQITQRILTQSWADPARVREHVTMLLQACTFQAVADAAQVGQMTVWEIAHATRPAIRQQTAAALLAVQPADLQPPRMHAGGAMWRLRSLVAMGHPAGRIATALGVPGHIIAPLLRGDRATITCALHHDITQLFDAWWDKQPPRRTPQEKTAACKALQHAALHGWPCPAALDEDELDQPGYQSAARWRYARGTGVAADDPLGQAARHRRARPSGLVTSTAPGRTRRQTPRRSALPRHQPGPGGRTSVTAGVRGEP